VAKKPSKAHLTAERIQAFLDNSLSRDERDEVHAHSVFCGSCQAEIEAWRLLYSELDGLPELRPGPNFRDHVLASLDTSASVTARDRAVGWLRRRAGQAAKHVDPERLQDYVDGLLPAGQMARISTHLDGCGACSREEEQWRSLILGIRKLPVMAPSSGFNGRVMARIHLGQLVRPAVPRTAGQRALHWAGRLVPRTQRAWAVISGIALTPATVMALLGYAVFSNPLVTPGGLASFLWWRVSGGATVLWTFLANGLVESGLLLTAYSIWDLLAAAPAVTAVAAVSFAAATSLAGWVLYRNLITTQTVDGKYAGLSL
jgi:anti-sigma factor RsiW